MANNALSNLFSDIAEAIRNKTGNMATMKPIDFPSKIYKIEAGSKEDINEIEDILDLINGEVVGESQYTVTFVGADGTELCQVRVYDNYDCPDPSKDGTIETPKKASTRYFSYTFIGWSNKQDGSADDTILKKINENMTVYAVFEAEEIIIARGECGEHSVFVHAKWKINPDYMITIYGGESTGSYDLYNDNNQPWAVYSDKITEAVIEDGVQFVGPQTFFRMKNLRKVSLPKTLVGTFTDSFTDCQSLKSITIPAKTALIYEFSFGRGERFYLTSVVFEKTSGWQYTDTSELGNPIVVEVEEDKLKIPELAALLLEINGRYNWKNTGT